MLCETEKDSKNFLGQYGSRRMKEWQDIVKLYERDNLYLAEAASRLARNVNYEVPFLKKQAAKCLQLQEEADKKEADSHKSAASIRNEYTAQCKLLGVPGKHLKQELRQLATQLPELLQKAAKLATDTKPAQQHYSQTAATMLGRDLQPMTPLLAKLAEQGDFTVFEWRKGKAPTKIEHNEINFEPEPDDAADEIDFGDGGVDFGDDIDFGIEVAESGAENGVIETIVEVLSGGAADDGVARGEEALSVLDFPDSRNQALDELIELEAFLQVNLFKFNRRRSINNNCLIDLKGTAKPRRGNCWSFNIGRAFRIHFDQNARDCSCSKK